MDDIAFVAPFADVLVVEDVAPNMMVMKKLLEPYQVKVTTCVDGESAVAAAETNDYDMIFMDMVMPGMDGFEAVKRIRETSPYNARLPIVAVSASEHGDEFYLNAGMNAFLPKPVSRPRLEDELRKWIPRHKLYAIGGKSTARPHATEKPADLYIAGVDVNEGYLRSDANMDKYTLLLAVFKADGVRMMRTLAEVFNNRDLKGYLIEAMAVKGAASQIGAWGLSDMAGELESACRDGNHLTISARHTIFMNLYGAVLTSIGDAIGDYGECHCEP